MHFAAEEPFQDPFFLFILRWEFTVIKTKLEHTQGSQLSCISILDRLFQLPDMARLTSFYFY